MLLDPLQARVVLARALEGRFALLAVNADSPAAITDVLEAALHCRAPVIIETSLWQLNGHSFGAGDPFLGMARYLVQLVLLANSERFRGIPVLFHTDHIRGPVTLPLLEAAIRGLPTGMPHQVLGPSTLSLDSSALTEAENVGMVLRLCAESDRCGRPIALEMEAGVDDGVTPLDVARRLVGSVESRAPGRVTLWAPGVGTRHGLGTQDGFSPEAVLQHRECVSSLAGRPIGIALHGSSGVPENQLREAVQAGVVKVNWSSESLLVRSTAAREFYESNASRLEKNHPDWKTTAMDHGVQSYVSARYVPKLVERIRILGGEAKADLLVDLLRVADRRPRSEGRSSARIETSS